MCRPIVYSTLTLSLIAVAAGSVCAEEARQTAATRNSDLSWLVEKSELTAGPLLPPLHIPGDSDTTGISAITIRLRDVTAEGGAGEVVIDRSEMKFNDFGDAERVPPRRDSTYAAILQGVDVAEVSGEGRCLYAVRFEDKTHVNRFYLVLSPGPITRDRLLVVAGDATPPELKSSVMEMSERPVLMGMKFQDIISLEPMGERQWVEPVERGDSLSLSSPSIRLPDIRPTGDDRPVRVELYGRRDGQVRLAHDPNLLTHGPYGDVEMTTLIGYSGAPYDLRRRQIDDPAQKGRLVYDLLPADENDAGGFPVVGRKERLQYTLVISPTSDDSDRLLIRRDGRLTHMVPLIDRGRSRVLRLRQELANSPAEWNVIEQVRSLIGFHPHVTVKGGHVHRILLYGDTIRADVVQHLADLPNLKAIELNQHPAYDSGETPLSLHRLTQLEHLQFRNIPIDDIVLQDVAHLQQLRGLHIDHEAVSKTRTNPGLQITDEGLRSIANLAELANLRLQGFGITDAGLQHLTPLRNLHRLNLYQTSVTIEGMVAFAHENPVRQISLQTSFAAEETGQDGQSLSASIDQSQMSAEISGTLATDEELAALCEMTDLKTLRIESRVITNEGLLAVSKLRDLESLSVNHNPSVTAEAFRILRRLPRLRKLNLWECESIDDRIVDVLAPFTELRELDLGRTKVSEAGFIELRADLLKCKVLPE